MQRPPKHRRRGWHADCEVRRRCDINSVNVTTSAQSRASRSRRGQTAIMALTATSGIDSSAAVPLHPAGKRRRSAPRRARARALLLLAAALSTPLCAATTGHADEATPPSVVAVAAAEQQRDVTIILRAPFRRIEGDRVTLQSMLRFSGRGVGGCAHRDPRKRRRRLADDRTSRRALVHAPYAAGRRRVRVHGARDLLRRHAGDVGRAAHHRLAADPARPREPRGQERLLGRLAWAAHAGRRRFPPRAGSGCRRR